MNIYVNTIAVGVSIFILIGLIARHFEKKEWNNGICETCNTKWKRFDTASDGSRGYFCSCGKYHSCWISYNIDKIK